jgi:hypothetical protein
MLGPMCGALRHLKREAGNAEFVFVSERKAPYTTMKAPAAIRSMLGDGARNLMGIRG